MSELGIEYDAHNERIRMLTKELNMKKTNLTSLVEQGEAIKAQRHEHQQRVDSLGQLSASRCEEATILALELKHIDVSRWHCLGY